MRFEPKCAFDYNQIMVFDEDVVCSSSDYSKTKKLKEISSVQCEKLRREFKKVDFGDKHSDIKKKGNKMIYRHIVFPCSKQIYFLKNLHVHSHFSISSDDIVAFVKDSRMNKVIYELNFYSSYKSYMNDFIVIINYGTKAWTHEIDEYYGKIGHSNLPKLLETYNAKRDAKRDNIQKSFGFSSQSYTTYIESCTPKPRLLKGTLDAPIISLMESLSCLFLFLSKKYTIFGEDNFNNQERNLHFSKTISSENIFEGFTICLQNFEDCLGHHIDQNNCRSKEYSGVFGASAILEGKKRTVILGYGKNVALKYFEKLINKNNCSK
jgi:hypothetical protein